MTRSLSGELRGRVIAAIEEGLSTREAARRFQVGISTAGGLVSPLPRHRRDRSPQAGPAVGIEAGCARGLHSRPDRGRTGHHASRDRGALAAERGVRAARRRCGSSSTSAASRSKKDGARLRAAAPRCIAPPHSLVRRPDRSRPREADLHRRDRGFDEDGAATRLGAARRAVPGGRSPRSLEDHHIHRRAAARRLGGADAARRPDER